MPNPAIAGRPLLALALLCVGVMGALSGCSRPMEAPPPTADVGSAVETAVAQALPTATPTTPPDVNATIEAGVSATMAAVPPTPVSVPTPLPTFTPAPTPVPTPTPVSTSVPSPVSTSTPVPTIVPTPVPTPTPVSGQSPPQRWRFDEGVSSEHRKLFRDEMERVRAFFRDRFGIEATGFTAHVETGGGCAADPELGLYLPYPDEIPVFHDYTPDEIDQFYLQCLDHEYFHMLQYYLGNGFFRATNRPAVWLIEGTAEYASYLYQTPTRPGWAPWLVENKPYHHVECERVRRQETPGIENDNLAHDLEAMEARHEVSTRSYGYDLSFVATVFLVEELDTPDRAWLTFWALLDGEPHWQDAFEEAFGIALNDFYSAFGEWVNSGRVRDRAVEVWLQGKYSRSCPPTSDMPEGYVPEWQVGGVR